MAIVKGVFKFLWFLICLVAIITALYYILGRNGIADIQSQITELGGFWEFIKSVFVNIWNGTKALFVK